MTYRRPTAERTSISRRLLLQQLSDVDASSAARARVLELEVGFQDKIDAYLTSLKSKYSSFEKLSTSPFVLLVLARQQGAQSIPEIDRGLVAAKSFSSIETSTGKMIEQVVLPIYGWDEVPSSMASANSSLDGLSVRNKTVRVATLKSGPRCLNDTMAERLADDLVEYGDSWAQTFGGKNLEYSFGALYGTRRRSNKKDWHILRHVVDKVESRGGQVVSSADESWSCKVVLSGGTSVDASVRIGQDWWTYLGGPTALVEVATALVRACVALGQVPVDASMYAIPDLAATVSAAEVPRGYNVGLLQRSQLPWFFLTAWHYCDDLVD